MRKLLSVSFVALGSLLLNKQASGQTISTFAGGTGSGVATNLAIQPNAVAIDTAGNVYIADNNLNVIRKVDKFGACSVIAGTGFLVYSGDGGPATAAGIVNPVSLALDAKGNIYIGEGSGGRIRKIDATTGIISTFAGGGTITTFQGDGHRADSATLSSPNGLAVDAAGNLYIADGTNHKIRKVDATTGIITTIAGLAQGGNTARGYNGDGRADTTRLNNAKGVAVDAAGNVYFAESGSYLIRKLTVATNMISTIAGTGTVGTGPSTGIYSTVPIANGAHADSLNSIQSLTVDAAGNVYFPDFSYNRVIKIDGNGYVTVLAGTAQKGYSGDGGNALNATMINPKGVTFDKVGNMYIAEFTGQRIRKVDASGIISTIAGNGLIAFDATSNTANYFGGDGGVATSAQLKLPKGIAVDAAGNVHIYDLGSASGNPRIRKINAATHVITTIAGNGQQLANYTGDTLRADTARLFGATIAQHAGVVADANGNVYISDGQRVRKIDALGRIIKVAGNNGTLAYGQSGYSSDGGRADTTRLNNPAGLALDAQGNLYIADYGNHLIRKVNATTGIISIFAGNVSLQNGVLKPSPGYSSDGGKADTTRLNNPSAIVFDAIGNAYIADYGNHIIRKVDAATGTISKYAGTAGTGAFGGDGQQATAAKLKNPSGLTIDTFGNLYIAEKGNHTIRKINMATGIINTIAGIGTGGYNGNSKRADSAQLNNPYSVAVDGSGTVYISDYTNNLVRTVSQGKPTLSLAKSKSTICTGDSVTLTATPTYGGTAPVYQWYVNGSAVGTNSNTYSYVPANGDSVACVLTSNDRFALTTTATKSVKLSLAPPVTTAVSIAASQNNICSGTAVTYTATATNGGTAPAYQWTVNGANAGANTDTFSYNPANNDVVSCVLTNNATCAAQATDTSNNVSMVVNPTVTPTVSVIAPAGISTGQQVTFNANVTNGGANPQYQWRKNGADIAGATQTSYTTTAGSGIKNNDKISLKVTNTDACGNAATSYDLNIAISTGINDIDNNSNSMSLYPSPNDGSFTVKGAVADKAQHSVILEVYNTLGQSIYKEEAAVNNGMIEHQVNLSKSLPSGNYFLKLNDAQNSVIRFTLSNK